MAAADIASSATGYAGIPYKWGGYLPSTGWDCSGFVNYILGSNFGMTLPGGYKWTGKSHGPVAAMYKAFGTGVSSPQPGDLCVWLTHIGIATSSSEMISALDPSYGTALTPIKGYGPAGEPVSYRRILNAPSGSGGSGPGGKKTGSGCVPGLLLAPAIIGRNLWLSRSAG